MKITSQSANRNTRLPPSKALPKEMVTVVLFSTQDDARWNMKTMVDAYANSGHAQILVEQVAEALVDQWGVIDCGVRTLDIGTTTPVYDMVEKTLADHSRQPKMVLQQEVA